MRPRPSDELVRLGQGQFGEGFDDRGAEPDITGAELGRRLNMSSRQGQRLLSRLSSPAPAS